MSIKQFAILTAIIIGFSFTLIAHVQPSNAASMPNLTVDVIHGQANHVFDVRNAGESASGFCYVRLSTSAGQSWLMRLAPLPPNGVFHVSLPTVVNGVDLTVTLDADCYNKVFESNEADNAASIQHYPFSF